MSAPAGSLLDRKRALYADRDRRPVAPVVLIENIPAELRAIDQWIGWRLEWRDDKRGGGEWAKVPIDVQKGRGGRKAMSNDPATWAPFAQAVGVYQKLLTRGPNQKVEPLDGIGFVFAATDPFAGIDLDGCRDPDTGVLEPWAAEVVAGAATYCEISPSGLGVKLIGRGAVEKGYKFRDGQVEVYSSGRYFCITGAVYRGGDAP